MKRKSVVVLLAILLLGIVPAFAQSGAPGVAKQVRDNFIDVDRKILEMARDWPADNYDYKLRKEMRSFGAVLVHLASGNVYAAKIGRGEKAKWDELDPAKYPDKAAVVALLEKSFADSEAVLKGLPDASFGKSVEPWLSVMEHSGEHYGLLVAYYRANGTTPPESRPKK
jgi:DinB superfamily